jgi:hypothetical protein
MPGLFVLTNCPKLPLDDRVKLKTKKILQIHGALSGLSLRPRVTVSEGEAVQQAYEPYAFPAQTKVNILRNLQLLKPLVEVFSEAQQSAITEISEGGGAAKLKEDKILAAKFADRVKELQETEHDVKGLLFINWADLDVAKVPVDVIHNLDFLVRGAPKPDDADLIPE